MPLKEVGNGGVGGKFGGIGGEQMQAVQDLNGKTGAEAWSAMVFGEVGGVVLLQVPGVFYGSGKATNFSGRLSRMALVGFFRHSKAPPNVDSWTTCTPITQSTYLVSRL